MTIKHVSVRLDDGKKITLQVPFKTYVSKGLRKEKPTKEAEIVLSAFDNWAIVGSVMDRGDL